MRISRLQFLPDICSYSLGRSDNLRIEILLNRRSASTCRLKTQLKFLKNVVYQMEGKDHLAEHLVCKSIILFCLLSELKTKKGILFTFSLKHCFSKNIKTLWPLDCFLCMIRRLL